MLAMVLAAVAVTTFPAPVSGDFDGDGRKDVAEVVARGAGAQLVVRPGAAGKPLQVVRSFPSQDFRNFRLSVQPPGVYPTACGKGLGPSSAPCPRKSVTLAGETLGFGTDEASLAVAIWNGRSFEIEWLSD